jgi:hypothetical protein
VEKQAHIQGRQQLGLIGKRQLDAERECWRRVTVRSGEPQTETGAASDPSVPSEKWQCPPNASAPSTLGFLLPASRTNVAREDLQAYLLSPWTQFGQHSRTSGYQRLEEPIARSTIVCTRRPRAMPPHCPIPRYLGHRLRRPSHSHQMHRHGWQESGSRQI